MLRRTHAYYYQCQHILLVTGRKFCVVILHAANGPDSVERIAQDEPIIAKISEFLTAFWMRVVAPEIFEMRVPRDLLPFILPQLNPDGTDDMDAVNTDIFPSASPDDNSELLDHFVEAQDCVVNTSRAYRTGTYSNEEICVAEALINVLNNPTHSMSSVCHHQDCGLTIFPWSGVTSTEILLTNTCPLDNWMMIFQALVKSGRVNLVDLPESGNTIARALQLVDSGLYADAKLVVLESLRPQPQATSGTLDLYGNESDFFLKLLKPYLMSTTTSNCCSAICPNPVQTVQSTSLILLLPTSDISGEDTFFDSLEHWLYPDDSQCGRKLASKPSEEVSFYEDLTLNEHGDAHTSWHCAGVRVSAPCTLLNLKSFVLFSVDLLSRGSALKLAQTPFLISCFGQNFSLYGATLWNGGHYICTFQFSNGWFMYDGLMAYARKDSGVSFSPVIFEEPPGYSLSYLIYCRTQTVYSKNGRFVFLPQDLSSMV